MTKSCKQCAQQFEITEDDLKFYDKVSPVIGGKKFLIPPPTLCPACRQQSRISFRNEKNLYNRKCDLCGNQIISIYSPDKPHRVYCGQCWWSDKWDPAGYAAEYDPKRPFFEQFNELMLRVPRLALYNKNTQNSEYTNHSSNLKNCYLCADVVDSEDIYYSKWIINHCKDIVDSYQMIGSELCYESLFTDRGYNCVYAYCGDGSRDCAFIYDCKNCSNCFMCHNLRNKEYCIRNRQVTKEEYLDYMKKAEMGSFGNFAQFRLEFLEMLEKEALHQNLKNTACEECTGDFLFQCKNVKDSYGTTHSRDCRFLYESTGLTDCYDCNDTGFNCELQYDSHGCDRSSNMLFCNICYDNNNLVYSDSCHDCHDLLGCAGLRQKKFHILNKAYSQKEYEELAAKIIGDMMRTGEWGEFIPVKYSPFAYNETLANDYFPLTEKEAVKKGFGWKESDSQNKFSGNKYELPDDIKDIPDDITRQILTCSDCSKNYKVIPQEIDFYRKMKLPAPRKCMSCRAKDRLNLIPPRNLWKRACTKCGAETLSSYAPERPAAATAGPRSGGEKVYCEKCYLKEVY